MSEGASGDLVEPHESWLTRLYAFDYVPVEGNRAAWTLADCDCEPCITHCVRCDGRRLMIAMVVAHNGREQGS